MSTKGEKETSWHHKGHDINIITRAFFIARGRFLVGIWRWAIFLFLKEQIKDIIIERFFCCKKRIF